MSLGTRQCSFGFRWVFINYNFKFILNHRRMTQEFYEWCMWLFLQIGHKRVTSDSGQWFFFWQTVRTFQSPIENLCIKFFFLMFSENKSLEWNICLFYLKKIHEGCTRPCFCPMRELLYIIVIICRMREIFSSMRSLWAWHLVEMRVTRLMRETWQVCSICNAVLGKRDTGFPQMDARI